jgi:hypothetical protein
MWISIILVIISLGIFWKLTNPLELRGQRWIKIIPSLLIVFFLGETLRQGIGFQMIGSIFMMVLLTFIWAPTLSHYSSKGFIHFLFSDSDRSILGGFVPDYHIARSFIQDEKWDEAMKAVENELDKDLNNYEGRRLMASLLLQKNQPDKAIPHLQVILANPHATEEQKQFARHGIEECQTAVKNLKNNGG